MRPLQRFFSHQLDSNHDSSPATIALRRKGLHKVARQLALLGYIHVKSAHQIQRKHIWALVKLWKEGGTFNHHGEVYRYKPLTVGSMKTMRSYLRWSLKKVGRAWVFPVNPDPFEIGKREHVPKVDQAQELDMDKVALIEDEGIQFSLRLQKEFGLRKEESIKFTVSYAYAPGAAHIQLKGSWCKNGRPRDVPVETDEQRLLLNQISAYAGSRSLIPDGMTYKERKRQWDYQTAKVGLHKLHGVRQKYLQGVYEEVSGLPSPVTLDEPLALTPEQVEADVRGRLTVSQHAGHNRIDVAAQYVGAKSRKRVKENGDRH